jgi:hypothetical protein
MSYSLLLLVFLLFCAQTITVLGAQIIGLAQTNTTGEFAYLSVYPQMEMLFDTIHFSLVFTQVRLLSTLAMECFLRLEVQCNHPPTSLMPLLWW